MPTLEDGPIQEASVLKPHLVIIHWPLGSKTAVEVFNSECFFCISKLPLKLVQSQKYAQTIAIAPSSLSFLVFEKFCMIHGLTAGIYFAGLTHFRVHHIALREEASISELFQRLISHSVSHSGQISCCRRPANEA